MKSLVQQDHPDYPGLSIGEVGKILWGIHRVKALPADDRHSFLARMRVELGPDANAVAICDAFERAVTPKEVVT